MASRDPLLDFSEFDLDTVVADLEEIRKYNPQRFEMEQLTAIVFEDTTRNIAAGYKDVTDQEFWVRGHMPDVPLMPGVVMCEAAAQLASYYVQHNDLSGAEMVGFGGMEDVRFRDVVRPGDRLVLVAKLVKIRPGAMLIFQFEGFVQQKLVVSGKIKGIPLPIEQLREEAKQA